VRAPHPLVFLSPNTPPPLQNASLDGKQKLPVPPPRPARGRPPQPSPSVRKNPRSRPAVPIFTNNSQESDTNLSESVSVSLQNGLPGRQTESIRSTTSASPRPATPALPSVRKISRSRPPFPFSPTIPKNLTLIYRNRLVLVAKTASLDGKQNLPVPPPRPARGRPPQPSPPFAKFQEVAHRPPFLSKFELFT